MFIRKCLLQISSIQIQNLQSATVSGLCLHPSTPASSQIKLFGTTRNGISNTILESKIRNRIFSPEHFSIRQLSANHLFRLTETSSSQLQPFLDVDNIIKCQHALQNSIIKRQLTRQEVKEVQVLFEKAEQCKAIKEKAKKLREENTVKCQDLIREDFDKRERTELLQELKEKGRQLREEMREAENKFNDLNDQLVDFIISLPNFLDKETPNEEAQLVKEVQPLAKSVWDDPEYTAIETQCGPGLLAEFPVGKTAWMDIDLRGRAQLHLLHGGFVETGNAEYVKRLILQGAGINQQQFLRVREPNVKRGLEHTTYLVGGASFPSFLALFAQSIIEEPEVLPLRYFVIGRSYESQKTKPGFYQSHVVQAFVACRDEVEMEREFQNLQSLMESFYSEKVGFAFQTQMVPAPRLQMYERKKLAFVMNKTDKSPSKMIGTLSTVGDYVSKRLLCCYFNEKKKTKFLHLVSAKFFDITHFLRSPSPKVISHTDILARVKPHPEVLTFKESDGSEDQHKA